MPMMGRRRGRPGLVGMAARTAVVAGTATAVAGGVSHHQQKKYAAKDQAAYEAEQYEQEQQQPQYAPPPPQYAEPAPAPEPAEPDYMAELEQLAALKGRGIISEEEFEAKKKQLLGI